ncbi:cysteinyl-tRNA synthetase [Waddlia chondrophila 2032/99]|nr:cysteine--tRNA ligase [Waddlia chondrophila]CCB92264.1 cysteinyl-tRNA synthetase [Waddlia chondrophila 2032/99]
MASKIDINAIPLKFFNTITRSKDPFKPISGNRVSLYTCGPTVYNFAHIGNYRTYMFEDLLRRTLKFFGYEVEQVMNLTDVDDKTIRGATEQNVSLDAYTKPFKEAFFEDIRTLNIEPAEHYPAATDYIDQMIAMIEKLLEKGAAYRGADGSVYYAIETFKRYGCLSHLKIDELKSGASDRVASDEYEKDNVADFVLWKSYDPERDGKIYWDSPFGKGRPGWHLECSTMAMQILGETIDLHCGGVDNMFPHHENEIAQSEACSGQTFVKMWLHSEHLIIENKKMSKSLGNFFTLRDLLEKGYSGKQVRYILLQTHYKTQLNFTFEGLEAVKHSLQRLQDFVYRLQGVTGRETHHALDALLDQALLGFANGLADDLNISVALASLYELVRDVNGLIDQGKLGEGDANRVLELLKRFNSVLGVIDFEMKEESIPDDLIQALDDRIAARQNKDWSEADRLRDYIQSRGYVIEDFPSGSRLKKVEA